MAVSNLKQSFFFVVTEGKDTKTFHVLIFIRTLYKWIITPLNLGENYITIIFFCRDRAFPIPTKKSKNYNHYRNCFWNPKRLPRQNRYLHNDYISQIVSFWVVMQIPSKHKYAIHKSPHRKRKRKKKNTVWRRNGSGA